MTWGEFKALIERKGIEDTDEIGYFDFSEEPRDIDRYSWESENGKTIYRIMVS